MRCSKETRWEQHRNRRKGQRTKPPLILGGKLPFLLMLSALQGPPIKPFSLCFSTPGHRWPSPSVADTAHCAGMHGAEAWSSHQTVSPDRASKSCFLCTIRQLTALPRFFLFSFLFPLFFNISTCSRLVIFPFSFPRTCGIGSTGS